MKIMYGDLKKKIRSSRFRDIQKSAKSPNLEQVALTQVVRKRVSFRERKYTKISYHQNIILSSILTLLKNNFSHL